MESFTDKAAVSARLLLNCYYRFLRKFRLDAKAYRIDFYALKDVSMRYWRDVARLHMFHGMKRINSHKIAGYYAYWLCKLRPICVVDNGEYATRPSASKFINEAFALYVAFGRINSDLSMRDCAVGVSLGKDTVDSFLYSLRYRIVPGDALAIMFGMAKKASLKSCLR